jgi:ClpP class serine protease
MTPEQFATMVSKKMNKKSADMFIDLVKSDRDLHREVV